MNDYLYPIKIKKKPQTISFQEHHVFDSNKFKLAALQFIGNDWFEIEVLPSETGFGNPVGITVKVHRSRLETGSEMAARVAKEEAYMEEYNKRNKEKPGHKLVKKI